MVLGRLVGRACRLAVAVFRHGWLPLGLAGPAVPVARLAMGAPGAAPGGWSLAAAGHACPSPRPVAERTPADHHAAA